MHSYFLTICTNHREEMFLDRALADLVVAQFRRTSREMAFGILAYCVMPDHVHLLVHGRRHTSDFRRFVKRIKQSTGQSYSHSAKRPLWQEGYYDRVLRPEEAEAMVARYIIENPVRAGLVTRPCDYPYVGSDEWSLDEIINAVV
jgi:putative transposase